jgi:hypothetical protein
MVIYLFCRILSERSALVFWFRRSMPTPALPRPRPPSSSSSSSPPLQSDCFIVLAAWQGVSPTHTYLRTQHARTHTLLAHTQTRLQCTQVKAALAEDKDVDLSLVEEEVIVLCTMVGKQRVEKASPRFRSLVNISSFGSTHGWRSMCTVTTARAYT